MDARIMVFIDLDKDRMLNMMVQHTSEQGVGWVLFMQNNFYYDTFFMKAICMQHFPYILSLHLSLV
jgi:integrin alpha FG-GAP repeat containing protein 1